MTPAFVEHIPRNPRVGASLSLSGRFCRSTTTWGGEDGSDMGGFSWIGTAGGCYSKGRQAAMGGER